MIVRYLIRYSQARASAVQVLVGAWEPWHHSALALPTVSCCLAPALWVWAGVYLHTLLVWVALAVCESIVLKVESECLLGSAFL